MKKIEVILVQPEKPIHSMTELEEIMRNIRHNLTNDTTTVVIMPKSCKNNYLAVGIRSCVDINIEQCTLGDIYIITVIQ